MPSIIRRIEQNSSVVSLVAITVFSFFMLIITSFCFWKFSQPKPKPAVSVDIIVEDERDDDLSGYVGHQTIPGVMGSSSSPRSSKWEKVRNDYYLAHPNCAFKGCKNSGKVMNVHHVKPFHLHPESELDPNNLITLCVEPHGGHHLAVGHLGSFKDYNPNVREDCENQVVRAKAIERMHVFKTKQGKTLLAP